MITDGHLVVYSGPTLFSERPREELVVGRNARVTITRIHVNRADQEGIFYIRGQMGLGQYSGGLPGGWITISDINNGRSDLYVRGVGRHSDIDVGTVHMCYACLARVRGWPDDFPPDDDDEDGMEPPPGKPRRKHQNKEVRKRKREIREKEGGSKNSSSARNRQEQGCFSLSQKADDDVSWSLDELVQGH